MAHAGVRPGHLRAVPARAARARCATRSRRRTRRRDAAAGGRRLRRRHPARPGAPAAPRPLDRIADGPRRRSPTCRCCCCGGRATRCSPTATCATCATRLPHAAGAPLRGGLAPGHRGRAAHRRRRRGAGWRDLAAARRPRGDQPGRGRRRPAVVGRSTDRAGDPAAGRGRAGAGAPVSVSFALLDQRVRRARRRAGRDRGAARATGSRCSSRPAPTSPPRVYACWRAGAVDRRRRRGAGPARAWRRALRGAGPAHVIGIAPGPGRRPGACGVPGRPDRRRPAGRGDRGAPSGARHGAGRRWPRLGRGRDLPAAAGRRRRVRRRVHLRRDRPGQGRRLPPPAGAGPARGCCARPTASPPTTGSWPRSRRSRSTGRRSASPPRSPTWTSPRPARSPRPRSPTPSRPSTRPSSSPRRRRCATWWRPRRTLTAEQRAALGGVRLLMSAGAPVPAALLRAVRERAAERRRAHAVRHDRGAAGHRHLAAPRSRRPGPATGSASGGRCPGSTCAVSPLAPDGVGRAPTRSPTAG